MSKIMRVSEVSNVRSSHYTLQRFWRALVSEKKVSNYDS